MNKLGGIMASRRGRRKELEPPKPSTLGKTLEEAVEEVEAFRTLLTSFQKSLLKSKNEADSKLIDSIGKGFHQTIIRFTELHGKILDEKVKIKKERMRSEEVEEEVETRVEENGSSKSHKRGRKPKKERGSYSSNSNEDESEESTGKRSHVSKKSTGKNSSPKPTKKPHVDAFESSEAEVDLGLDLEESTLQSDINSIKDHDSSPVKKINVPSPKSSKTAPGPNSVKKVPLFSRKEDMSEEENSEQESPNAKSQKLKNTPGPKSFKSAQALKEKEKQISDVGESEEESENISEQMIEKSNSRSRSRKDAPGPKRVKDARARKNSDEDEDDEEPEEKSEPIVDKRSRKDKNSPGPKRVKDARAQKKSDDEEEAEKSETSVEKRSRRNKNAPGPKSCKDSRTQNDSDEDEEDPIETEVKKKENGVKKIVIKLNKDGNSVREMGEEEDKSPTSSPTKSTPSPVKRGRGRPKKNKTEEETQVVEKPQETETVPKIKIANMKNLLVNFSDAETEESDKEENVIEEEPSNQEVVMEFEEEELIQPVKIIPDPKEFLKENPKFEKCSVKIDRLVLSPKKIEKLKKLKFDPEQKENEQSKDDLDTSVVIIESTSEEEQTPVKRSKRTRKVRAQSENEDSDSDVIAKQKKKKIKLKGDNSDYEEEGEQEESPESNSDSSGVEVISVKNKKKFRRLKKMNSSSEEEKKPRKRNDSESEFTDSDSDKEKKKKKRKRKKKNDSDDDDDDDNESTPKGKGRKDLRKMVDKGRDTKEVEKEEEDRKKRIADKQKQFNGLFRNPETDVIDRLVLDFDPKTKEPLISVDEKLVAKLKPHQAKGIKFMWDTCFESMEITKKHPERGGGGILAHCMGLGKTLQSIAFLHTIMTKDQLGIKMALVICPLNTVGNWARELKEWLDDLDEDLPIHRLWEAQGPKGRADALKGWEKRGGVGILHYEAFRGLALLEGRKLKKSEKETFTRILLDPGPHIVICDEGHLLKNENSKVSKAVNKIKTLRRIVLTGTPLQNNLIEYHTMMSFVKPKLLGTTKEFRSRFVNPITNGQHKDSTDRDVRIMKRRAHVLHKLLDGCVQRMDFTVLTPYLPPKFEFVLFINLSEVQVKLYEYYLREIAKVESLEEIAERMKKKGSFFRDYQTLQKVLTHPLLLSYQKEVEEGAESDDSINDFICDDESEAEETPIELSGSDDEMKVVTVNKRHRTRGNREKSPTPPAEIKNYGGKWWSSFFESDEEIQKIELSGKLIVLMEILKICESIGDKVLVFSQYLTSLDLIESFLNDIEEKFKTGEADVNEDETIYFSRWRKNIEYFRIDGSVKTNDRQKKLEHFNDEDARKAKLFLISTKAGGMGVNLVGANRVILFDVSWNPSQDLQSLFRAYRFGQKKPVYVYRLLAQGTMEEKIYNRQVVKLSLSCRVVDEQQIERHFKFDDIAQMYRYNPEEKNDATMALPADHLLADLITNQKKWIDNYIEHDTLLANKEEEELTEEERKAAWDDYESEKNRPLTFANAQIQQTTDYELANIRQTLLSIHVQRGINMDFNLLNVYAQHAKRDITTLKTLNLAAANPRILPEIRASYTQQIVQIQERLNSLFSKGYNNDYFPQTPAPNPNLQNNPFMNLFNSNLMNMMGQRMRMNDAPAAHGSGTIPTASTSRGPALLNHNRKQ